MGRGYSALAVDGIKFPENAGGLLRAAHCYGAGLVVLGGRRIKRKDMITDTGKVWRHVPVINSDDVMSNVPMGAVPIAVDLVPGAVPLHEFKHPHRGFYIFGAEDQTLSKDIRDRCPEVIYVPTVNCMNLAATANVVLYDRCSKRGFPDHARLMESA